MALFNGNIHSKALGMETQLSVILPHDRIREDEPCKVLYLLHGLGENASSWHRYSSLEWYVRYRNIAVVMPEVQRSFYADMAYGLHYFTYMTEELPALCKSMFRISPSREDTCIAGLSMGGYGALRCLFTRPDLYKDGASFSGAVDLQYVAEFMSDHYVEESIAVLGEEPRRIGPDKNLFELVSNVCALPEAQRPRLLLTCGEQDELTADQNRKFRDHLRTLPIDFDYREWPGGHDWAFWDTSISTALDFFFGKLDDA